MVVRRFLHHIALKTKSELDNMLLRSLEWPIIVGAIMSGAYFAVVSLPFVQAVDFEIRRGFHVAYIAFGGWTIASVLDATYRWFKLEITPKTNTALDDWIVSLLRLATPVVLIVTLAVFSLELYGVDTHDARNWLASHGSRIALVTRPFGGGAFCSGRRRHAGDFHGGEPGFRRSIRGGGAQAD